MSRGAVRNQIASAKENARYAELLVKTLPSCAEGISTQLFDAQGRIFFYVLTLRFWKARKGYRTWVAAKKEYEQISKQIQAFYREVAQVNKINELMSKEHWAIDKHQLELISQWVVFKYADHRVQLIEEQWEQLLAMIESI